MVSIRPLTFNSTITSINLLVIVPSPPITIGITITFMFPFFLILKQGVSVTRRAVRYLINM